MIHVDRDCLLILALVVIGSFISGVYEGMHKQLTRHWPGGSGYCRETVPPYWNTLLECTSETCHRPLPCEVHGAKKGGAS